MGGKICIWFMWGKCNEIYMEGSPESWLYMLQMDKGKVNRDTPTSMSIATKDMYIKEECVLLRKLDEGTRHRTNCGFDTLLLYQIIVN